MQLHESHEQIADFRVRTRVVLGLIIVLSALIVVRLWLLQMRDHERLAERADRNRTAVEYVTGVRGLIYDRAGTVLADNTPSWQLDITPEQVEDMPALLDALADTVELRPHERQRFEDRRRALPAFAAVPLKLNLTRDELARLAVQANRWPGVQVRAALARRYPLEHTTAHVLGYVGGLTARDLDGDSQGHYRGASHIGKVGLERAQEDHLRPVPGQRRVENDARGRRLRQIDYQPPTPGWNLRVTLDAELQKATAAALGPRRGAAVAIDPRNGEVLALVSQPGFDPHLFINGIGHADYQTLISDPQNPLFNRAIQGRYPPGSTIKPLVALAGLEYQVVTPSDHVFCQGWFQLPNKPRKYRDWKRHGHGSVNLRESVAQSCDVYYYELAHALGIDRLARFGARLGIGQRTGLELPSEDAGILPSREWKIGALGEVWFPGETLNIGIGQGYMVTTPLQLAQMTALLAQRGVGYVPRLVKSRFRDDHTVDIPPQPLPPVNLRDPQGWETIHQAMLAVVYGAQGTARSVGQGLPFRVAGKTGTAQVAGLSQEDDEAPQLDEVPERLRDHALFIAYAPADAPQMAIAVVVENSGSGSAVAAPVARAMLENWLMRCDGVDWRPWCLEADI
ncbi:MAG: penicillin-binding protein 2 [Oceanococcaceae bacterium]